MAIRKAQKRISRLQPQANQESGLCRIRRAAEFLSVSQRTVERLIQSGHLETVKVGRSRRVKWPSLRRLADCCE